MQLEGDSSMTYDDAVRAEAGRAALHARWGDENYRGYVQRPDIQIRLKQLGQLLGATWNGSVVRAFNINAESQAGSNTAARFARGLDNLTIRPLNSAGMGSAGRLVAVGRTRVR